MDSSGWMRISRRFDLHSPAAEDGKDWWGAGRNWMKTSDTLLGSRFPVRRIEGHVLPSPVVHKELERGEGFGSGVGGHAWFVTVRRAMLPLEPARTVLAPHGKPMEMRFRDGAYGPQHVDLLVADLIRVEGDGWLHGDQAEHLHQVVLHHVPEGARVIVVAAAVLHPHLFSYGDLHVVDVSPVPDRLEEGVGKAKGEQVLHRLLAQIVVDPVDLGFIEDAGEEVGSGPWPIRGPRPKGFSTTMRAC